MIERSRGDLLSRSRFERGWSFAPFFEPRLGIFRLDADVAFAAMFFREQQSEIVLCRG